MLLKLFSLCLGRWAILLLMLFSFTCEGCYHAINAIKAIFTVLGGVLFCYLCYFHFLGRCAILLLILLMLFSLCLGRCAILLFMVLMQLMLFSLCLERCAILLLMLFSSCLGRCAIML